jgi:hypothetical protein
MLPLMPSVVVAQVVTAPPPSMGEQYITQPQEIRQLPGQLDNVNVFNSNSPEVVKTEGVLLSTFPGNGMFFPYAHLNKPLNGRFDLFTHHISRPSDGKRTLYQGVIIYNPTEQPITLRLLQAVSYVNSPDAPFIQLPSLVEDPIGRFYSGPGSRLTGDILRGLNQMKFPSQIVIPPRQTRMLFSLPIKPSTARSTLMRLQSDGPVYMANLAMYEVVEYPPLEIAQKTKDGKGTELAPPPPPRPSYRPPTLGEWQNLLVTGRLVEPRDLAPTPLEQASEGNTIYGRVAGVSVGSEWFAKFEDKPGSNSLSIPQKGQAFSYPLSTVSVGTYGTRQVQSAPMLVRYPDTAFLAHGNYAVHYNLTLPLHNNTGERQTVAVSLQTPIKQDRYSDRLFFLNPPQDRVFFRGTIRVTYTDDRGQSQVRYFHIIQRQGQQGEPLISLNLLPGEKREVNLEFLYPPDATPPQVVTVRTQELFYGGIR